MINHLSLVLQSCFLAFAAAHYKIPSPLDQIFARKHSKDVFISKNTKRKKMEKSIAFWEITSPTRVGRAAAAKFAKPPAAPGAGPQ